MKVLHLVAGELGGGAARGAYWLHRGLLDLGVNSFMLTNGRERLSDQTVASLAEATPQKLKFALLSRLGALPLSLYPKRKSWIFSTGITGVDFTKHPAYQQADIVHLHWINGLVAMRTLRKVHKPIVWTIRDMWPMTGGCHYALECEHYTHGCGNCPQLGSEFKFDLSRIVVSNKKSSLPRGTRIVGISSWLSDCARKSKVFRGREVQTISNNINTKEFFPIEQKVARQILGLPQNKKLVLLGAQSITDFYKGFDLLLLAIKRLDSRTVELITFGNNPSECLERLPVQQTHLGFLRDTISLRLAYSAADVFVAPSRMDAFGKTIAESMSCGTPVVCFDATGPADIVEHKVTGYKADPFDPADLAAGIEWVLSLSGSTADQLRVASRARVVAHFDSRVIASQYLALYNELTSKQVKVT